MYARSAWLLVVDDDPELRVSIAEALATVGCEVVTAGSGADALSILARRRDRPAAIFVDQVMPGMTGVEFIERLRRIEAHAHTHVVLMTGLETSPAGALVTLRKPFSAPELVALASKLLAAPHAPTIRHRA